MKKITASFFTILLSLIFFTACPLPCGCGVDDFYRVKGIEASLDTSKLESEGIVTVNLKGTPKVDSKEKKKFDACDVRITVVSEGNANVKITELVSSTNLAYKEWKWYDNDTEKLEILDIRGGYELSPGSVIDDEIVLSVNEKKGFYIWIDFELKNDGYYAAEDYYNLRLK